LSGGEEACLSRKKKLSVARGGWDKMECGRIDKFELRKKLRFKGGKSELNNGGSRSTPWEDEDGGENV